MPQSKEILSDRDIIELYWKRDESAISATDRKYRRYLYTVAQNIIKDPLDSEECLNDTYLGTWNAIPPTRPSVLQVFLSKLTRNIAVSRFRRRAAAKRIPSEMTVALDELDDCFSVAAESVEETVFFRETVRILNEYLLSLDDEACFLFVCRYYYADPVKTIAHALHMGESTVYRRLSEMREEIKRRLCEEGYQG